MDNIYYLTDFNVIILLVLINSEWLNRQYDFTYTNSKLVTLVKLNSINGHRVRTLIKPLCSGYVMDRI